MSKMNKSLLAASVLAALSMTSGTAMAEVSMNIGATSNYIWRGITQTADEAAVSGGLDYEHDSGFYLGAWTSSLGNNGWGAEFDYYAGFGGSVGDFGYDVNVNAYTYPQLENANFTEVSLSGTYSFFTVGLSRTIASDVTDASGSAEAFIEGDMYYYVSADVPLGNDLSLGATFGSYKFEDDGVGGTDLDYNHYQLALTKSAGDAGDVTLAYDQNDIDDTTPGDGYKDDSGRISISWGKTF